MNSIFYEGSYKYQLKREYQIHISIKPSEAIITDYIELSKEGMLIIKKGYAWDGPSGPTIDTLNFMRGSLVHDALYQLMREQKLSKETYRKTADQLLKKICREDGMNPARAWLVYKAVRFFAGQAADAKNDRKIIQAPKKHPINL